MLQQVNWKRLLISFFLFQSYISFPSILYLAYKNLPADGRNCYANEDQTPIGSDFISFYSGFHLSHTNNPETYNPEVQYKTQQSILSESCKSLERGMPFAYPPPVLIGFSWLGSLDYMTALAIWSGLSLLASIASFYLLGRYCSPDTPKANVLLTLASICTSAFAFFTIIGGQASWLGIVLLSVLYYCLHKKKLFLAGVVASCTIYKPPIFLILVAILLLTMGMKFFRGFLLGACIFLIATFSFFDTSQLLDYLSISASYNYGENFAYTHQMDQQVFHSPGKGRGAYSLITRLTKDFGLIQFGRILFACIVISITLLLFRNQKLLSQSTQEWEERIDASFPVFILTSLTFSIWIMPYDLSMLALILIILHSKKELPSYQILLLASPLILPLSGIIKLGDEGFATATLTTGLSILVLLFYNKHLSAQLKVKGID